MKNHLLVLFIYIVFGNQPLFSQIQDDFYNIDQVQEIKVTFPYHNWKHQLDSLFLAGDDNTKLKCDVSINGKYYHNAGIRYKGFSSCDVDYIKNPFSINLDYMIKNQNYEGYTKLKLSNVIRDPSFLREALSYEIARKYMPASKANFANVYINDTLIGLYTNVQAVDEKFAEDFFKSHHNSFFKGSPAQLVFPYGDNANLAYNHGTDSSGYFPYYSLESEYGWDDLLNLIYILNNDTAHISSVLNIDRTLWMHAFNYSLVNLDSYIGYSQNYYMYKDDNGIFNPIIWDLNMSFASFRNSDATNTSLTIQETKELNPLGVLNYTGSSFSSRPLIKNLFLNATNRRMFLAHMRTIINENIKNNEYYLRGQHIQSLIDTLVQNDPNKFYSYTYFINNIDTTVGPYANQYPGLRDVMEARISYLDTLQGFQ